MIACITTGCFLCAQLSSQWPKSISIILVSCACAVSVYTMRFWELESIAFQGTFDDLTSGKKGRKRHGPGKDASSVERLIDSSDNRCAPSETRITEMLLLDVFRLI